jgi:hypothetical protein
MAPLIENLPLPFYTVQSSQKTATPMQPVKVLERDLEGILKLASVFSLAKGQKGR